MATNLLKPTEWEALATPGKRHDGDGLYLDVRSATSASWLFKYTFGGKVDEVGLGSRKKVSLDRARELRAWAMAELGADRNPKVTLAAQKLETHRQVNAGPSLTVYETAKANITLIAKKLKTERGRRQWVRSLHRDFLGYVADMQPRDVGAKDIEPLLKRLYAATPTGAEVVRHRLAKLLSWCKATDSDGVFPANWENPARWEGNLEHTLDRGEHKTQHHAALAFNEVGRFVSEVRTREAKTTLPVRLALEWHIISATRANEATACDWSEFDWANDCWVIPAERMKMRRPHRVPLTVRHHEIINLLLAGREPPPSGPLFSVNGSTPIWVGPMREAAYGVQKGITLHGFRSSFATWARSETYDVTLPTGEVRRVRLYDEAMIEESLGHAVGDTSRNSYVRDDFLELRRPLLESWAAYCGKVQAEKVVPMRRRLAVAA